MKLSRLLATSITAGSLAVVVATSALADPTMPPRPNLVRAKQIAVQLQAEVQQILVRAQGGGTNPNPGSCQAIRDQRTCKATPGCGWLRGSCVKSPPFTGVIAPGLAQDEGDVDENDNAAEFALEGLGSGLFQLGQLIDQANWAWGTPGFWQPWQEACQKDGELWFGADAGKVTASLPLQGFISPADFEPLEQELQDIHATLFCP